MHRYFVGDLTHQLEGVSDESGEESDNDEDAQDSSHPHGGHHTLKIGTHARLFYGCSSKKTPVHFKFWENFVGIELHILLHVNLIKLS
jgi:hypothetical protein